jgi:hypothetical protein
VPCLETFCSWLSVNLEAPAQGGACSILWQHMWNHDQLSMHTAQSLQRGSIRRLC